MTSLPMYYFSAVWGKDYTQQYLTAVLPTFLAAENFGSSHGLTQDRYFIYTTRDDAALIQSSPQYQALCRMINTEVRLFDGGTPRTDGKRPPAWDSNRMVNQLYAQVIPESIRAKAALVMLTPDQPWSNGSFAAMRRILMSGKRVVSLNCLMVDADTCIPEMQKHYNTTTCQMPISSRDMVRLGLSHLHEIQSCFYVNAPHFPNYGPSSYLWEVEGEGSLMYIIGGDPKAIIHPENGADWPMENGFEVIEHIYQLGMQDSDLYWAQESDEIYTYALDFRCYEDADFSVDPERLDGPISSLQAAHWIKANVSKPKQRLLSMPMHMNYGEKTERWAAVEQQANAYMQQIFDCIDFLDSHSIIAEDLDSVLSQISSYRTNQQLLQDSLENFVNASAQLPDQTKVHAQLFKKCGIQGDVDGALKHLLAMGPSDLERSIEVVQETATLLNMTRRQQTAQQLLGGSQAILRAYLDSIGRT